MSWFKKTDEPVKVNTFTKKWVNRCLTFSWICIFWCFLLATMGKEQVAENLAVAIVMNIVGVLIGYFAKSFFETREEKRVEQQERNSNIEYSNDSFPEMDEYPINDVTDSINNDEFTNT